MGGVRTAPEEGGTMNTAAGVCLWLCSAAVVTGLTVLCNAGGAWMGGGGGAWERIGHGRLSHFLGGFYLPERN